jgi:hypothetical protein
MNKLSRDYLLIVTETFYAKDSSRIGRRHEIEKGEIIQFRYQHSAHFRTLKDDKYFVINQETFKSHTEILGTIWSNVESGNQANLNDIFRLKLFDWKNGNFNCLNDLKNKYPNYKEVNGL